MVNPRFRRARGHNSWRNRDQSVGTRYAFIAKRLRMRKAMGLRSYVSSSARLTRIERPHNLLLVKGNGLQRAHNAGGREQVFSPAEMRHNFAIWPLRTNDSRCGRHLYYCIRCKWVFTVDRCGAVIAMDANFQMLSGHEATERLVTFSHGPCPVFRQLMGGSYTSPEISPSLAWSPCLSGLIAAISNLWKSIGRGHRARLHSSSK
jgi:hypothetical protein